MNLRSYCTVILTRIIYGELSITQATKQLKSKQFSQQEQSKILFLIYGVIRRYYSLSFTINLYLTKKIRAKDKDIECLLLLMTFQLLHTNTPSYAAISENVQVARILKKPWATGMINAIGRSIIRQEHTIPDKFPEEAIYEHPTWMIEMIRKDWPDFWEKILTENNAHAPFTIRTITKNIKHENYKIALETADIDYEQCKTSPLGLIIKGKLRAEELPFYNDGGFIVQDEAAQLITELVSEVDKKRMLDVCAAPGGKTCALIDSFLTSPNLVALDIHKKRIDLLKKNLSRLNFSCSISQADATENGIFASESFDLILVDAPCSSSGVIRRHPDIKIKKSMSNLQSTIEIQAKILSNVWEYLVQGGELIYITCSVFKKENDQMILKFLKAHHDAELIIIREKWGVETKVGRQILPGMENSDGFFFSKLKKI